MAQQSPLSKSLNVSATPAESADAGERLQRPANVTPNTFAVDPNFRVGYAQNWQISVQRDLPAAW